MMNLSGTASNALLIGDASPFFPNSVADAMRQAGGVAVALLLCSNATVRPNDTLTSLLLMIHRHQRNCCALLHCCIT